MEGHLSLKGGPVVMALSHAIMTGEVPREHQLLGQGVIKHSFLVLGEIDDHEQGEINKVDPHMFGVASDGATKQAPKGTQIMHVIAKSSWCQTKQSPVAQHLACRKIEYEDAATCVRHDKEAGERLQVRWDMCNSSAQDNTAHAKNEGTQLLQLVRGEDCIEAKRAVGDGCYRHSTELQGKEGMKAAFPNGSLKDFVWMLWEVLSSRLDQYKVWWDRCHRERGTVQEGKLWVPSEPCDGKWEVMSGSYAWVESLMSAGLAQFCDYVRGLLRGGSDNHKEKWNQITANVTDLHLMFGVVLGEDWYSTKVDPVHVWCKGRSEYGSFEPHHHRHEMAVHVLRQLEWYREAGEDGGWRDKLPAAAAFIDKKAARLHIVSYQSRLDSGYQKEMEEMVGAVLEKGEELCRKHGEPWLRVNYLLGAICCEQHRRAVATKVLLLLGKGDLLLHHMGADVSSRAASGHRVSGQSLEPEGSDWVECELLRRLGEQQQELKLLWRTWGMDKAEVYDEWLSLATAKELEEQEDGTPCFYFSQEHHPLTHWIWIDR